MAKVIKKLYMTDKSKTYKKIYIMAMVLFFHFVFVITNPDPYMGIADYYYFLLLYIAVWLIGEIRIRRDNQTIIIGIMFVYSIIPLFISIVNSDLSTGYFFSYLLYLAMLLSVKSVSVDCGTIQIIVSGYIISAVIIALWIIFFRYDFYGGGIRHTVKFLSNEAFDPNFLAAYLVVPSILSFSKTLKRINILNFVETIIIISGMLFTSSRGALISSFIGIVIVVSGVMKKKEKWKKLLPFCFIVLLGALFLLKTIPFNSLTRLFSIDTYIDSSNRKRIIDWKYGLEAFFRSPILGYGFRGEMSIIKDVIGVPFISHNTYIAFLLQLGVIGCVLPIMLLISIIARVWNNRVLLGIMVATLLVSVFISAEVAVFFWMPIILTCLIGDYESGNLTKNDWL